ncbi:MAG: phenylalanine--tRNA ligase subunit beta [Cyanobacteria bacterium]|nr:phenylalanine--tRNA ligase subunit beta [Cyanobacteriota bacterium]
MKVSLQWLRELVASDGALLEPEQLAERLSIAGFEVEAIEDLAAASAGVVVGLVQACEPHADARKLNVCQVHIGADQPLQIVCGAANVRSGIHVAVAPVGTHLPAVGLTIKEAELRGVASAGMICSLQELGLAQSSEGIAILEDLLPVLPPIGAPLGPALDLDDQVLELAITANRPDGLSMQGIAREVAALSGGHTTLPPRAPAVAASPLAVSGNAAAAMEAGGLFSVTALKDVKVAASPSWLQRRLELAGLRPINNVVDITNLVMLETGQPLHAFDREALAHLAPGPADPAQLGLRQGHDGEKLLTLDGENRPLGPEALLVTYGDQPIALAGVMGGATEAVTADTTSIWLEAAVFASEAVRRSSRSVGLRSEASSRFEKGLPRENTLAAADRAVALLQELAGAQVEGRWCHGRPEAPRPPVVLNRDALHNLLGPVLVEGEPQDLEDSRIEATLEALGCQLEADDDGWAVTVPAQRALDLKREVDLIEEVARLVGYDQFDVHLPDPLVPGGLDPSQQAERRLRRALCAAGLQELSTLSLVRAAPGRIPLANPLLADTGHLRDNLYEELLQAARRNRQAFRPDFWAFEIGRVYLAAPGRDAAAVDPATIEERLLLGGIVCGERRSERWSSSGKPRPPGYFEARGLLQAGLQSLGLGLEDRPALDQGAAPADLLHPGRSAQLIFEGRPLGWFGQLHPAQARELDLPDGTYLFELPLAPLLAAAIRPRRWQPSFAPFATVPPSERDLALVVPRSVTAAELLAAIRKAGKPLLEQAELLDRYEGAQVEEGCCSQAFRLRYRAPDRTLTDGEVDAAHQKVVTSLESRFDARLRR